MDIIKMIALIMLIAILSLHFVASLLPDEEGEIDLSDTIITGIAIICVGIALR